MCPKLMTLWLALTDLTWWKPPSRRRPAFRRPLLEALEDRALPSNYTAGPLVQVSGPSPFAACAAQDMFINDATEPKLAVNPTNPRNIVGVWQQDDFLGIVAGVSFDGGGSWTRVVIPGLSQCSGATTVPNAAAGDPWLSFAPNGDLYASSISWDNVTGNTSTVMVNKSTDGGLTWGPPATLIYDTGTSYSLFDDRDSVTVDPNNPRLVYTAWDRSTPNAAEVGFARSTDGGKNWEPYRQIFNAGPTAGYLGNTLRILPDGTLLDFFDNNQLGPVNQGQTLSVIRSLDHGRTWLPSGQAIPVASMQPAGAVDPDTGTPIRGGGPLDGVPVDFFDVAVDPHNSNVYAVWTDASFNSWQYDSIAFSMSSDGGLTWSNPIKINQTPDNIPIGNRQAFTPSVAVAADGTVAVTYYDFRFNHPNPGLPTDYWMASASPQSAGGLTNPANWANEIRLTDRSFNIENAYPSSDFGPPAYFLGDYLSLTSTGNDFLAMFGQALSTPISSNVFFRRVEHEDDSGAAALPPALPPAGHAVVAPLVPLPAGGTGLGLPSAGGTAALLAGLVPAPSAGAQVPIPEPSGAQGTSGVKSSAPVRRHLGAAAVDRVFGAEGALWLDPFADALTLPRAG
jgi:hypothetical protein